MMLAISLLVACGGGSQSGQEGCPSLSGEPWTPGVPGIGADLHDPGAEVTREVYEARGAVLGRSQPIPQELEVSFSIPVNEELGPFGSLSLIAEVVDLPSSLSEGAFPYLVSLSDGVNELIHLPREGRSGDCAASGYFSDDGFFGSPNPGCAIQAPSAYFDHMQWVRQQESAFGYLSVNSFPTCNWAEGNPTCAFNGDPEGRAFFEREGSGLRSGPGIVYTARYVLLSGGFRSVPASSESGGAGIRLTVIKKKDPSGPGAGAMDLNLVLVGSKNIQASRTPKGRANLNSLLSHVRDHYGQANVGLKVGRVTPVEWKCEDGGDAFAVVDVSELGRMFRTGSEVLPLLTSGEGVGALNIYLVSLIEAGFSGRTLLGVSGGIWGPMINGTSASGLAFSSFDMLEKFNPSCESSFEGEGDTASCEVASQDPQFIDMGVTISHEMGHFLGLSHLSEATGTERDKIPDTPACQPGGSNGGRSLLTVNACKADKNPFPPTGRSCAEVCEGYDGVKSFCPEQAECEFNHIMWWTAKNYHPAGGIGDGNLFSRDSAMILHHSPFVR